MNYAQVIDSAPNIHQDQIENVGGGGELNRDMNGFAMPMPAMDVVPEEPNEENEASYDSLVAGGAREENEGAADDVLRGQDGGAASSTSAVNARSAALSSALY